MTHAAQPAQDSEADWIDVPPADGFHQLVVAGRHAAAPAPTPGSRPIGSQRGAWAVWWLSAITLGIYYLVWYARINRELRDFCSDQIVVNPTRAWLSQLVPVAGWISLANTATRLNTAHESIASPVRVSSGMAIISSFWFGAQTRYLQRRLNDLWDAAGAVDAQASRA